LSAKRILYYSLILGFILCAAMPLHSYYGPADEGEDIGIILTAPPEVIEEAGSIVKGFLTPRKEDTKAAEAIKERADRIVAEAIKQDPAPAVQEKKTPSSLLCSSKVYYLMSFSMPSDTLSNVITDALRINDTCGKKVVLVGIRGFLDGSMKETLKRLFKLVAPVKRNMPLSILSKEFKAYDVKRVPFIIVRSPGGEKTVMGDMSIQYAVEGAHHGEVTGMTYSAIIERDFYDMMASKAKAAEARLRSKRHNPDFDVAMYDGHFKKADKDNVFHVDPSHTVEKEIKDQSGAIIVKKGTTVNPSDYTSLGKYVFINGNDPKEVEYAMSLKPQQIILVAGNPVKLSKKYGMPFYVANDELVHGLGLSRTPSIIEQNGRLIRVTEKKL
jgi:type-F conjugative transfer system pilin assembly protein TrbC